MGIGFVAFHPESHLALRRAAYCGILKLHGRIAGKSVAAPPRHSRPFRHIRGTVLLVVRSGQWNGLESLEMAAGLVDLGAVLYAMVAVLVERGVDMVFWALERRKQRIEERKRRIEEGKASARAAILAELLADGILQTTEELEHWAQERGIPLDKVPPR